MRKVSALSKGQPGEKIAIFSDYDCDGIPGAVVLHDFSKQWSTILSQNYIPHRHYEGLGWVTSGIDTLQADGVTLIITIDCENFKCHVVVYAKEQGIDGQTDSWEPEVVCCRKQWW